MTNYDHVVSTRQHPKSIHTPKTTKNNQKQPKITKNDQKLPKITKKDQKYHPMTSDVIDESQQTGPRLNKQPANKQTNK